MMFLHKSHVKTYIKQDGHLVKEHFDIRKDPRHKRYIDAAGEKKILDAYKDSCLTIPQIASKFGCGTTTVSNIIRKHGAASRQSSDGKINDVIKMYLDGKSANQISRETGVPATNILRWVKNAGVSRSILVPPDIKNEMIRLYTEEQKPPSEISKILGVSKGSVAKQILSAGMSRRKTEASALRARKNNTPRGLKGWWQSTKTGKWEHAGSITEMLRMQQLDNDPEVKEWSKNVPIIKYGNRSYLPDFIVISLDGSTTIEEVKWEYDHNNLKNIQKWEAAKAYCTARGWYFKVISEKDVGGTSAIKHFAMHGLQGLQAEISKNTRERANELARARYKRDKELGKNPSHRKNMGKSDEEEDYQKSLRKSQPEKKYLKISIN